MAAVDIRPRPMADQLHRAQTTGDQNNCGLNALVHTLVPNMGRVPENAEGRVELCDAFNARYNTQLTWEALILEMQGIVNPVDKERILGPVLRRLLLNERDRNSDTMLTAVQVQEVAHKFNIRVESYATHEATRRDLELKILRNQPQLNPAEKVRLLDEYFNAIITGNEAILRQNPLLRLAHPDRDELGHILDPNPSIATLTLLNTGNHWEYGAASAAEADEHNAFYAQQMQQQMGASPMGNLGDIGNVVGNVFKGMGGMSGFVQLITQLLGVLVQGFMQLLSGISKPGLQITQPGFVPGTAASASPGTASTPDMSAFFAETLRNLSGQFQPVAAEMSAPNSVAPFLSQFGIQGGRVPNMTSYAKEMQSERPADAAPLKNPQA